MSHAIRVSARAIVLHEGQVLLNCFGGGLYYNFPGGGIEANETAPEAAVREVFEESGLRVAVERHLFTFEYEPTRCGNFSGSLHGLSLFFQCRLTGSPKIDEPTVPDHSPDDPSIQSRAQWVPVAALPRTPFVPETMLGPLLNYIETGVFEPSYFAHFNEGV